MASLTVELPEKLAKRLADDAKLLNISEQVRVVKLLEQYVAPRELLNPLIVERGLPKLVEFLNRIPAVRVISSSKPSEPQWWVKLDIDIDAEVAWQVVQELGFVLNYISLRERLATVFMPVSPPPYLNGGPREFLSWAIEAAVPFVDPSTIAEQLEASLPSPVEDLNQWLQENDDDDNEFPGAVPEIPVTDLDEALAYYENNLGFAIDWGGGELGLAGISKGACRMFLANSDYRTACGNVGPVLIWLNLESKDEVDDLYRLWSASGAILISEPESKPWGLHEFMAKDPDGNLFRAFYDFGTGESGNDA